MDFCPFLRGDYDLFEVVWSVLICTFDQTAATNDYLGKYLYEIHVFTVCRFYFIFFYFETRADATENAREAAAPIELAIACNIIKDVRDAFLIKYIYIIYLPNFPLFHLTVIPM